MAYRRKLPDARQQISITVGTLHRNFLMFWTGKNCCQSVMWFRFASGYKISTFFVFFLANKSNATLYEVDSKRYVTNKENGYIAADNISIKRIILF